MDAVIYIFTGYVFCNKYFLWYIITASIELKSNKKIKSQQKIELIFCSHQNTWFTIGLYTRQTVLLSIEIILNPQTLKLSHGRETRRMSYSRHSRSPPKLMFFVIPFKESTQHVVLQ